MLTAQQARDILAHADMLVDPLAVDAAVDGLAAAITAKLANSHPLVLSVMGGAVVFSGQLLPRLGFPLDFDYVHASRYTGTSGGEIRWRVAPPQTVEGRTVLVLDDILDEGHTLAAIRQRVMEMGAKEFYSAVFADKELNKNKPLTADFVGLSLPNRYVFGFGMDVKGAWRNLPAIYAVGD